jgi:hypothetical protein
LPSFTNYVPGRVVVHNQVGRLLDVGEPRWGVDSC